ncbi:MAG: hypothetical protein OES26_20470, partial [Gammaproteobacteria bacterium]|nr:hypothetical protein [Gammaproteobacteria bacterium]
VFRVRRRRSLAAVRQPQRGLVVTDKSSTRSTLAGAPARARAGQVYFFAPSKRSITSASRYSAGPL